MKSRASAGGRVWVRRASGAAAAALLAAAQPAASAHFTGETNHDELTRLVARELAAEAAAATPQSDARSSTRRPGPWRVAQARSENLATNAGVIAGPAAPGAAAVFGAFAPVVRVHWDERFLWVESNGLPTHGMMTGITAWQQQVPLPQAYTGRNAWQIPLHPVVASHPVSIKDRFLRGAIALAANGIPIFNPQNNRGEVSQEIGELDQWGGHCGRADDYHYHVAPFHLQSVVGPGQPIAYALDGYPIYGLTEPDGTTRVALDAYNGHESVGIGYHYHGSTRYPYVNGGFHGVVTENEGQVDPQPRATGVRPALTALRGAKITGLDGTPGKTPVTLHYTVNGKAASVRYTPAGEGAWKFHFVASDGATRDETYRASGDGSRGGGPPRDGQKGGGPGRKKSAPSERNEPEPTDKGVTPPQTYLPKRTGNFALRSPAVENGGTLPVEFTGDGDSISPPLAWSGAPEGTQCFAVIMHHVDPEGKTKWYWTLYNIPAAVSSLPKAVRGIGTVGNNSINRRTVYAPPHSKGPGEKTYVLTAYALSAPLQIAGPAAEVDRAALLAAMKEVILDSAELKVVYSRPSGAGTDAAKEMPPARAAKG